MKGPAMAKGKKKEKKGEPVELKSPHRLTILVPDEIGDLSNKILHSIGRLTYAATAKFGVKQVAIVKTSKLPQEIKAVPGWMKTSTQ